VGFGKTHLRLFFIARMSLLFRFSALSLFKDITAQIAAGNQPTNETCKIRQSIPDNIFPLIMKDRKGRSMANNMFLNL